MRLADADLAVQRHLARRAHLARDGERQVLAALLVDVDDAVQDIEALLDFSEAEGGEGALGGRDRLIDIGLAAQRDLRKGVLIGRVDDVEGVWHHRIDPGAVDIELQIV